MRINLGRADNHRNWRPGEIAGFKDLQFGGVPFEYAEEALNAARWGMMRLSETVYTTGNAAVFSDAGGRTADYYQFTVSRIVRTEPADPEDPESVETYVTSLLTYRINAPIVSGGGYVTNIEAGYVVTNATPVAFDIGGSAGGQFLALNLNDAGYFDWAFVNPIDSETRPNVHNTDTLDGHQLYYVEDWYGSTVPGDNVNPSIKMVVKDNALTNALNMRAGMSFTVSSDMSLQYYPLSAAARGATTVGSTIGVNGTTPEGLRQAFGTSSLPAGESATINYTGEIMAPGLAGIPHPTTSSVAATTPVDADGVAQSTILITVRDIDGTPVAGIPAENIVINVSGTGNMLVAATATDASGQATAYLASSVAETKTVTVTVSGVEIVQKPAVRFLSTVVALEYSGDDIAEANGVMTIIARNTQTNKVLWEVDLTRSGTTTTTIKISRFTDGGTFNYAGPAGLGRGMISIGNNDTAISGNTFTQLAKTAAGYEFRTVATGTVWEHTTVFSIQPPDDHSTVWPITRTIRNISEASALPTGGMDFSLNMNIDQYTVALADASLSGTSGMAQRMHQVAGTMQPLLYSVYENVDRGATNIDPAGLMRGTVVVNSNTFTQTLGMKPGREFSMLSSIVAYYPSDLIGDAGIGTGASYLERLFVAATPREFMGSVRADHVNLAPNASYTVNYAFSTNISAVEADIQPIQVEAAISRDFTYQNAAISTADAHCVVLTLTITDDPNGNSSYDVEITPGAGSGTLFQVRDTANPLVKELVGSRRTNGYAGTGPLEILVTVTGVGVGGTGYASTNITVRPLGDIDGNGFVTVDDLGKMNNHLNGVQILGIPNYAFDINGNKFNTVDDLGLLNSILNGVSVQ